MGAPPDEPLDGGGPPSPVPPGSPPRRRLPPRLEGSDSLPLPDLDSGARSSGLPVRPAPPSLRVDPLLRLPVGREGIGATEPQTRFFSLPSPCSSQPLLLGFVLAPTSRPSYVGICRQLTLTVLAAGTASAVGVGRELMVGWGLRTVWVWGWVLV